MSICFSGTSGILASNGKVVSALHSSGRVLRTNAPGFMARLSGNVTGFAGGDGASTIKWNQIDYDNFGALNPTTGLFTAPVSGSYIFSFGMYSAVSNFDQTWWVINGARERSPVITSGGGQSNPGVDIIYLNKNDTIGVHPYFGGASGNEVHENPYHTYFSGFFIR